MRLGVLGSPTGWYMRDLQRAAEALPVNRATSIDSLSFAQCLVAAD